MLSVLMFGATCQRSLTLIPQLLPSLLSAPNQWLMTLQAEAIDLLWPCCLPQACT